MQHPLMSYEFGVYARADDFPIIAEHALELLKGAVGHIAGI